MRASVCLILLTDTWVAYILNPAINSVKLLLCSTEWNFNHWIIRSRMAEYVVIIIYNKTKSRKSVWMPKIAKETIRAETRRGWVEVRNEVRTSAIPLNFNSGCCPLSHTEQSSPCNFLMLIIWPQMFIGEFMCIIMFQSEEKWKNP